MKVSVVIVTKDRASLLSECLVSLLAQKKLPSEIVVVNNDSCDRTSEVVAAFSQIAKTKIKHILEKKQGYPVVYNRGLKEAQYDRVAFIDDDCVAQVDWFENIQSSLKNNASNVSAILGYSGTYDETNVFSLATLFLNWKWKEKYTRGQDITLLEILDNKNIVYNRKFLKTNRVFFDEKRVYKNLGAAEDCDLGLRIQLAGGRAIYDKNIVVFHRDPTYVSWYLKKLFFAAESYENYRKKWNLQIEKLNTEKNKKGFFFYFSEFTRPYKLTFLKKVQLLTVILSSIILLKIKRVLWKLI